MDIGEFLAHAHQHQLGTPQEIDAFGNDLPGFFRSGGRLPRVLGDWVACFEGWKQAQALREYLAQQQKVRES